MRTVAENVRVALTGVRRTAFLLPNTAEAENAFNELVEQVRTNLPADQFEQWEAGNLKATYEEIIWHALEALTLEGIGPELAVQPEDDDELMELS